MFKIVQTFIYSTTACILLHSDMFEVQLKTQRSGSERSDKLQLWRGEHEAREGPGRRGRQLTENLETPGKWRKKG